ncbi:hypothetical protein BC332_02216 [Capsicum chinense]|nr:hypothetical protein BC332_02216 [Capsicum chinense]
MKKLWQKHAKKDKEKESGSKKRGSNSPASKAPAKRRIVEEICTDKLPKIEQPNQEEIYVFVKGQIFRFFIYEFALITGLKCFGNVDDFKYEDSSSSWLMKRYFLQSTNGVNKEALVKRFLKENFENKEDVLQMAILYFIHTFIYSQLNASPMPFSDFKMVEDEKYEFFPWGKVFFSRFMASLRQEFSMEKQLYRLGGIPQVFNMWMFELCSNVDIKVAVKENNNIPRILNWRIVAVRAQFNQFIIEIFSKEKIAKQSSKEGQHSDDDADFEGAASDWFAGGIAVFGGSLDVRKRKDGDGTSGGGGATGAVHGGESGRLSYFTPDFSRMRCIMDLNHTHSRLAS